MQVSIARVYNYDLMRKSTYTVADNERSRNILPSFLSRL